MPCPHVALYHAPHGSHFVTGTLGALKIQNVAPDPKKLVATAKLAPKYAFGDPFLNFTPYGSGGTVATHLRSGHDPEAGPNPPAEDQRVRV